MLDNLPPVRAFGEWDAPITDEAEWIDPPLGEKCVWCEEKIGPGDNGAILPAGYLTHRECHFRTTVGGIGHLVNHTRYCQGELGTDAGLSHRQSALLVWDWYVNGRRATEADLARLRADAEAKSAPEAEEPGP